MEKTFLGNANCHYHWKEGPFFMDLCIGKIPVAGYFKPNKENKAKGFHVIDIGHMPRKSIGVFDTVEEAKETCIKVAVQFIKDLEDEA